MSTPALKPQNGAAGYISWVVIVGDRSWPDVLDGVQSGKKPSPYRFGSQNYMANKPIEW